MTLLEQEQRVFESSISIVKVIPERYRSCTRRVEKTRVDQGNICLDNPKVGDNRARAGRSLNKFVIGLCDFYTIDFYAFACEFFRIRPIIVGTNRSRAIASVLIFEREARRRRAAGTGESFRPNCPATSPGYYSKVPDLATTRASRSIGRDRDVLETRARQERKKSGILRVAINTSEKKISVTLFFFRHARGLVTKLFRNHGCVGSLRKRLLILVFGSPSSGTNFNRRLEYRVMLRVLRNTNWTIGAKNSLDLGNLGEVYLLSRGPCGVQWQPMAAVGPLSAFARGELTRSRVTRTAVRN